MSKSVPPRPAQPRLRDEKGRFVSGPTSTRTNLIPEPPKAPRRTFRRWLRDTLGLKG